MDLKIKELPQIMILKVRLEKFSSGKDANTQEIDDKGVNTHDDSK